MDEIVTIKESEMDEIAAHLGKSSNSIMDMPSNLAKDFSNVTSTGLLKKSVDLIGKQITQIKESIDNTKKSVQKTYDDFAYVEKSLKIEAEKINTPMDFIKNDSSYVTDKSSLTLNKEDGKAVNGNNETKKESLDFEKSMEYNDDLKKIVKEYERHNGEIDIKLNKGTLYSIENDYSDEKKEIDDIEIEKKNLEHIEKEESITVEFDDDTTLKKEIIKELNNKINNKHPEFNESFELKDIDKRLLDSNELLSQQLNNNKYDLESYKK